MQKQMKNNTSGDAIGRVVGINKKLVVATTAEEIIPPVT
jgi:hypothetical protein